MSNLKAEYFKGYRAGYGNGYADASTTEVKRLKGQRYRSRSSYTNEIRSVIESHPGVQKTALHKIVGGNFKTFNDVLADLQKRGIVQCEGFGSRGRPFKYQLTPMGRGTKIIRRKPTGDEYETVWRDK